MPRSATSSALVARRSVVRCSLFLSAVLVADGLDLFPERLDTERLDDVAVDAGAKGFDNIVRRGLGDLNRAQACSVN